MEMEMEMQMQQRLTVTSMGRPRLVMVKMNAKPKHQMVENKRSQCRRTRGKK